MTPRKAIHLLLLALAFIAWLIFLASFCRGQDPAPTPATAKTLAVYYPMGADKIDPHDGRKRSYFNRMDGYESIFAKLQSHYDSQGIKAAILHLPFGRDATPNQQMDFDGAQRVVEQLKSNRLSPLSKSTPAHFTEAAGRFLTDKPDYTLYVYFGALDTTAEMARLREQDAAGYYRRFADSISFATDIHSQFGVPKNQIHLVFDSLDKIAPDSLEFAMLLSLQAMGYSVSIEPHPLPEYKHLTRFGSVTREDHWRKAVDKNPLKSELGETMILIDNSTSTLKQMTDRLTDEHVDVIAIIPSKLDLLRQLQTDSIGASQ